MLRLEVPIKPCSDWSDYTLKDWGEALEAFLSERQWELKAAFAVGGYRIIDFGAPDTGKRAGELIFSRGERAVSLLGPAVRGKWEQELVQSVLLTARAMGAVVFYTYGEDGQWLFWEKLGAKRLPEVTPFPEPFRAENVQVTPLFGLSLLVGYAGQPVLCLEPIACNSHGKGLASLAQKRAEKRCGEVALGFSSRIAARCPWQVPKPVWENLLACSRLRAFECLERLLGQAGVR